MRANNLLYKSGKYFNDKIGLYSKRQCVRISTNIGKDLVDLRKNGVEITKEVLNDVVKMHIPKANLKIITDPEEYRNVLISENKSTNYFDKVKDRIIAFYYTLNHKTTGIFIPSINKENSDIYFAHEIEHFMYNQHTPLKKLFWYLMRKSRENFENNTNNNTLKDDVDDNSFFVKTLNFEDCISDFFGMQSLNTRQKYKEIGNSSRKITKFLAGEEYSGLTSKKRITAYIRSITRHFMHPKKDMSTVDLMLAESKFADESRAYKVADTVLKYKRKNKIQTNYGFTSDIYKRIAKVLKSEKRLSIKNFLKSNKLKKISTSLPINAHKLTRAEMEQTKI